LVKIIDVFLNSPLPNSIYGGVISIKFECIWKEEDSYLYYSSSPYNH
jgi:hypothetical protein